MVLHVGEANLNSVFHISKMGESSEEAAGSAYVKRRVLIVVLLVIPPLFSFLHFLLNNFGHLVKVIIIFWFPLFRKTTWC